MKNLIKARTQGTVRNCVTFPALSSLPILFPSLAEQKKTAMVLNSIEKAYQKTNAVVNQICMVKKALMQALFISGLPGKHTKFKKTSFGMIPKEWNVLKLEEVCLKKPEYGANVPSINYDPKLPRYVRITDISKDGNLLPDAMASIDTDNARGYLLNDGDLVFARSGATVGKTFLYKRTHGICAYAGYLIRVRLDKTKLLPSFLFYFTHSPYYYRWIKKVVRAGAQPNINAVEYARLKIPLPSIDEQNRICALFTSIDTYKEKEIQKLNSLSSIKSAAIQKMLD